MALDVDDAVVILPADVVIVEFDLCVEVVNVICDDDDAVLALCVEANVLCDADREAALTVLTVAVACVSEHANASGKVRTSASRDGVRRSADEA